MENKKRYEKTWEEYTKAKLYKSNLGLDEKIKLCVRMYEGDQWPEATDKTKHLPRPVLNVIKQICKQKESSIIGGEIKMYFRCERHPGGCPELNDFITHISRQLKQKELDRKAIRDGEIKGSYIYHYFYDPNAVGVGGGFGAVRGEVIDPLNIFFENLQEVDEQKQDWIIIATRMSVEKARKMATKAEWAAKVETDEENKNYEAEEKDSSKELCTVLTRYFKENGEVFYEKSTKTTMLVGKTSIDPHTNDKDGYYRITAKMYPISVGQYELKEKCIYGIGEVEPLIQNQKAVNFNIAMQILNVQNNAWGTYVVLPNALRDQKITNEPGKVLIDFSNTGNGIRKLDETGFSNYPLNLTQNLIATTKEVTGANNVLTGDNFPSNASGVAIAQLQNEALKPIEQQRHDFWRVREKCALILAQFCKTHYSDKAYLYKESQKVNGGDNEDIDKTFNGAEYLDDDIQVTAEAGSGAQFSEMLILQNLQDMLQKGAITTEEYILMCPEDYMVNKQEMLDVINQRKQGEQAQLEQKIQGLEEQNKQLVTYLQQMQSAIQGSSRLVNQNKNLEKQIAELNTEYTDKIETLKQALNQNAALAENAMRNTAAAQQIQ